jgi:hypothetical protein
MRLDELLARRTWRCLGTSVISGHELNVWEALDTVHQLCLHQQQGPPSATEKEEEKLFRVKSTGTVVRLLPNGHYEDIETYERVADLQPTQLDEIAFTNGDGDKELNRSERQRGWHLCSWDG